MSPLGSLHAATAEMHSCSLAHDSAGIIVEPLFNAFATAAFFEFVIFAIFEMRYLLAIWRARRCEMHAPCYHHVCTCWGSDPPCDLQLHLPMPSSSADAHAECCRHTLPAMVQELDKKLQHCKQWNDMQHRSRPLFPQCCSLCAI